MATVFTKIIAGEIPGRFVWKDAECVGFLSIHPLHRGHALVVPRAEVDHWIELEPTLAAHLMRVARTIGQAQQAAFRPRRIGLMIAGFEVPHTHLHVVPIDGMQHLDFAQVDTKAKPEDLDAAAERIREELRVLGCAEVAG
jgi:histidine triad (HIT) family protein